MQPNSQTQRDASFAETALRLGGKSEEEAKRLGAVDKADEQIETPKRGPELSDRQLPGQGNCLAAAAHALQDVVHERDLMGRTEPHHPRTESFYQPVRQSGKMLHGPAFD